MTNPLDAVASLGRGALGLCEAAGQLVIFAATGLSHLFRPPFYIRNFVRAFIEIAYFSLPVVALTAVFTGMVLALQSSTGLARFSAESAVASLVVLSVTRELGPVLAGLMVAGRVGAAMAAEIGTMRVTDQIDALSTLSTDPMKYLVAPRLLAGVIALPLLVVVADILGVLGLIEPDAGSIEIDGQDVLKLDRQAQRAARAQIGMLFQNGALFDSLPVWENVAFGLLAQKLATRSQARDRAAEILAQVGLAASVGDLSPAELSGGMQKRVALARAIAARPALLFFDEPTTGLDPIMGAVIDGLIVDCVKRMGSTAVAITHDMASAERIGDEAAMIHKGQIVWEGPAASLLNSGNAMVDQFTHGRRDGPIQMELRK